MNEDCRKYYIEATEKHKILLAEKVELESKLRLSEILLSKLGHSLSALDILVMENYE